MSKVFLDVRSEEEYAVDGLSNSVNIPHDVLLENISRIPMDAEVLVYCRSGRRADVVTQVMSRLGYNATNIENVANASRAQEE